MTRIHSMGTLSYLQGMSKREVVPWQSPNIILLIRRTHIEQFIEKKQKVVVDTKQEIKNYQVLPSPDFFRPNNVHKYSIVTEKKNLMKE